MSKRFVGLKSNPLSDIGGIPIGVGQKNPTAGGRVNAFSTETFAVLQGTEGKIRVLNCVPSLL